MALTQTVRPPSPAPATDAPHSASDQPFRLGQVATIAGGHFVHDTYTSFLAPLLPLIIQKLGLSLTLAGSLAAFQQAPSLINPLLGVLADRVSLRWFAIVAPAITAAAMSLIGAAPDYVTLAVLLLITGFSNAFWHVSSPVMVARASGRRVGLGMSLLMIGGELAYTIGPILIVAVVSWWGLDGTYRLMPVGAVASLVIYWRTRNLQARTSTSAARGSLAGTWRALRRILLPIAGIVAARSFMTAALTTYLPTMLSSEGASLWLAGGSLAIIELAGTIGVSLSGTLSDRLGRRPVLAFVLSTAPLLTLLFLHAPEWALLPVLFLVGMVAFSTNPVLMALVQEYGRNAPATANGLYMAIEFTGRSIILVLVGAMADRWGLRPTFQGVALLALCAVPFVWLLPGRRPAA
jgi:MFS transporter, FSR family, fosmidomycin resistance protein